MILNLEEMMNNFIEYNGEKISIINGVLDLGWKTCKHGNLIQDLWNFFHRESLRYSFRNMWVWDFNQACVNLAHNYEGDVYCTWCM